MKKLIILILLSSLLFGCRSMKKQLEITDYRTAEITKADTLKVDSVRKSESRKITDQITVDKKEKQAEGEIQIKGKTDSANVFDFHNVVNGDTLQAIHIAGNADFTIKSKHLQKSEQSEIKKEAQYSNIIQEVARKAVAQSTIKETAGKIKQEAKKIESKGFTFGAWVSLAAAGVLVALLSWSYFYLGGSWRRIFERLNKLR